jgi:hypothetical protein
MSFLDLVGLIKRTANMERIRIGIDIDIDMDVVAKPECFDYIVVSLKTLKVSIADRAAETDKRVVLGSH